MLTPMNTLKLLAVKAKLNCPASLGGVIWPHVVAMFNGRTVLAALNGNLPFANLNGLLKLAGINGGPH